MTPTPRLLCALSLLVGCSPTLDATGTTESALIGPAQDVLVTIEPSGVAAYTLLRNAGSSVDSQRLDFNEGQKLQWDLLNSSGAVVASGSFADPRVRRSEVSLDGTTLTRADVVVSSGSVALRIPQVAGTTLRVREPLTTGARRELGRAAVQSSTATMTYTRRSTLGDSPPVRVSGSGNSATSLDLLILSEGFKSTEMTKFRDEVKKLVNNLSQKPNYKSHWNKINMWRQEVPSAQSGIDDPTAGIYKDTAFGVAFGTTTRRCIHPDQNGHNRALQLGVEASADAVIIIANTTEHAGCATVVITQSMGSGSADTLAHELGHKVYGLSDEYETGGTSCPVENFFSPNVSSSYLKADLPWKELVTTNVLPTPETAQYNGVVGAFPGAKYCHQGAYRSERNCRMRSLGGLGFCAACAKRFRKKMSAYTAP